MLSSNLSSNGIYFHVFLINQAVGSDITFCTLFLFQFISMVLRTSQYFILSMILSKVCYSCILNNHLPCVMSLNLIHSLFLLLSPQHLFTLKCSFSLFTNTFMSKLKAFISSCCIISSLVLLYFFAFP